MYTGNGVTRKFPLPEGYDGSAVYLIFPTGKSIKMLEGEGYTVSEGAVIFSAAIPAGVVVSFSEPENVISAGDALNYVVIYKDGRIVEVSEDPTELLVQTQKELVDAKAHYAEVTEYADKAIDRVTKLKETLADEFEGLMYEYTKKGKEQITENAELLESKIQTELESAVLEIRKEAQTVEAGLQILELLKSEAGSAANSAAEEARNYVIAESVSVLNTLEEVKKLYAECKYYYMEAQSAAQKAGLEVQAAMTQKANEELEMLRSLRLKLEDDHEMLNARIDSAIEVLRNGR
mgnify:CR=1 FL=1